MKYFYSAVVGFAFVLVFSFIAMITSIALLVYSSLRAQGEPEVGWDLISMCHNLNPWPFLLVVTVVFAAGFVWNLRRLSKIPPSAL
jgi:hypothetical protein